MAYIQQYKSPFGFMQPDAQANGTASAAAGGGGGGGDGGGAAASPTAQPSQGSGQYTNFQRVLDANQGAGATMAGRVTNQVAGQAQKAQTDLGGLQGTYGQQAAAGTNNWNEADNIHNEVNDNWVPNPIAAPMTQVAGTLMNTNGVSTANAFHGQKPATNPRPWGYNNADGRVDPTDPFGVYSPDAWYNEKTNPYTNTAGAQTAINTGYTGPHGLADVNGYSNVVGETNTAQDSLNALGSNTGLQTLLQQQYGGAGGYGQGASQFDSLLTRAQGNGALRDTSQKYSNLSQALSDATGDTSVGDAALATSKASQAAGAQYLQDAGTWQTNEDKVKAAFDAAQTDAREKAQADDLSKVSLDAYTAWHEAQLKAGVPPDKATLLEYRKTHPVGTPDATDLAYVRANH